MKRNLYILLTLFAVLLAGCEHKDFCCRCLQADDVEVVFDWSRSPDAAPASMKVYFFPEGGGEALVYEFADIHGGSIRLPAGNYRAVCVNSDTEFLHYEHTDRFDSIRACTGGGVSGQLPGTDGEEFRNAPDRIWTDRLETFTIGHSSDQRRVIFRPAPSVCRYTVEIRNVSNLGYLGSTGSLRGSLTGLSDGLLLGTGEPSGHPVTLPFEATHDGKSTITADFLTFGPPAGATGSHLSPGARPIRWTAERAGPTCLPAGQTALSGRGKAARSPGPTRCMSGNRRPPSATEPTTRQLTVPPAPTPTCSSSSSTTSIIPSPGPTSTRAMPTR